MGVSVGIIVGVSVGACVRVGISVGANVGTMVGVGIRVGVGEAMTSEILGTKSAIPKTAKMKPKKHVFPPG